MRISNPKLFNGQQLVTKEQVINYLSGGSWQPSVAPSGIIVNVAADKVTYSATIKDTVVSHVSGALDAINAALNDINSRVDQTAVVEGSGLVTVTTGAVVNGVTPFTVYVPSAVAFANHTIELDKLDQATAGYASSYQLLVDGDRKGDIINIPKDQFLKGAEIVEGTYDNGEFTASEDGTKYIHFTFEIKVKDAALAETIQEKHIYLDVQDLCDVYTGGKGITVTTDNKIEADLGNGLEFTGETDNAKIAVKANTAKAITVDANGVAVNVDDVTIKVTSEGKLMAVIPEVEIPEVPVQSVSGGTGISNRDDKTTGDVILDLEVAAEDEIGGVRSGRDITVDADGYVDVNYADEAGKVTNKLTAFGTDYDGSEAVTLSGKTSEDITHTYVTYTEADGVFTIGTTGLDVDDDGEYITSANTVAANLVALDTAVNNNADDIGVIEELTWVTGAVNLTNAVAQAKGYADTAKTYAEGVSGWVGDLPNSYLEDTTDVDGKITGTVVNYIDTAIDTINKRITGVEGAALGIDDGQRIYFDQTQMDVDGQIKKLTQINAYDVSGATLGAITVTPIAPTFDTAGKVLTDGRHELKVNVDNETILINDDNELHVDFPVSSLISPESSLDITPGKNDGEWTLDISENAAGSGLIYTVTTNQQTEQSRGTLNVKVDNSTVKLNTYNELTVDPAAFEVPHSYEETKIYEVALTGDQEFTEGENGIWTATVTGHVLHVFGATGVDYPDMKYTTNADGVKVTILEVQPNGEIKGDTLGSLSALVSIITTTKTVNLPVQLKTTE